MSSKNLVNDIIAITSRLVALMTTEIERLRAHRPHEIEELQEEKAALARAYETLLRELGKHPEVLAGLAPALREELEAKTEEFQKVLAQNEASLKAAREVNARVLKAVADAVTERQKENTGYSRNGSIENGGPSRGAKAGPVTLDQTL
ncbi:MAG: hypothetical protein V3U18_02740 [Alphaproteobacteria bacterium]|jgi:chromosome segregation ATPase